MKRSDVLICVGLIVSTRVLIAAGIEAAAVLPLVGCVTMMGAMMGRGGGNDH